MRRDAPTIRSLHIASGSIGIDAPIPIAQWNRRRISISSDSLDRACSHVESVLAFDFDAAASSKRLHQGGRAFWDSEFLGAAIASGATGAIDTTVSRPSIRRRPRQPRRHRPVRRALDTAWMREPRYAGTVAGRFHVSGTGSDPPRSRSKEEAT